MMNDPALQWLSEQITTRTAGSSLWCTDENVLSLLPTAASWQHKPTLITNRWDVAECAKSAGLDSRFSDYDFTAIEDSSLQAIFYRVSKEKPVVHHILNESLRMLAPDGRLYLCGYKNEGIKTYIDKTASLFGCDKSSRKTGTAYSAILTKDSRDYSATSRLETADYQELRAIGTHGNITFYSKPGLFGWNKIDQGSEFLIAQLDSALRGRGQPTSLLDLGCGYGYLTLMTADLPLQQRVMTDNNAAALATAGYNCIQNNIPAEVIAADCGDGIAQTFDLILCNPPFHQGFSVDGDLTNRFLAAGKRLLARDGISLWVVNQFIPLERKAKQVFGHVEKVAENRSFKVIALAHTV
jgi:16S rRNA (guanine1207-N2)-methyltransferase